MDTNLISLYLKQLPLRTSVCMHYKLKYKPRNVQRDYQKVEMDFKAFKVIDVCCDEALQL